MPYGSLMFCLTRPATMGKQKRRTKIAAWWTFAQGKGREGKRMAISQQAPPAADMNNKSMATCQNPQIMKRTRAPSSFSPGPMEP